MKFKMGSNSNLKRLLAIVAMGVEEQAILKILGSHKEVVISDALNIQAKVFQKNDKELYLVTSGIGIVNAGLTTALVADKFQIDGVLLFGVAGAIRSSVDIGHLIVASQVIQYDSIFSGDEGVQLMAPGSPFVSVEAHERENPIFETDCEFRLWIKRALLVSPQVKFLEGAILSGSEFVGSAFRKNEVGSIQKDAFAVEMEAAGIAVVTKRLGLPFAVLKTIADRLNPDNSVSNDYNQFIKGAADNAGNIMDLIWRSWTSEK